MILQRLIKRAKRNNARFMLRYNPADSETWSIKFFPNQDDDAHFWSYGNSLDEAVQKLIDEMDGFV